MFFCMWIWRISQCFLHVNLTRFAVFFAYKYDAFRSVFCMWIWRKYSFLQRDVNEKRDCESYATKTVKPSFEPQTTSLMLKMRFLRRSGRKYEKSSSYGHGFLERSRKMCFECVHLRISPGWFWQGKLRKIAKNACKKGLKSGHHKMFLKPNK